MTQRECSHALTVHRTDGTVRVYACMVSMPPSGEHSGKQHWHETPNGGVLRWSEEITGKEIPAPPIP